MYLLYSGLEDAFYASRHPMTLQEVLASPELEPMQVKEASVKHALEVLQERGCLEVLAQESSRLYAWRRERVFDATMMDKVLRFIRRRPGVYASTIRDLGREFGVTEMAISQVLKNLRKHGLAHYPLEAESLRDPPYFMGPQDAQLHLNRKYRQPAQAVDIKRFKAASREEATLFMALEESLPKASQPMPIEAIQQFPEIRGCWVSTSELEDALSALVTKGLVRAVLLESPPNAVGYAWDPQPRTLRELFLRTVVDSPGILSYDLRKKAALFGKSEDQGAQLISRLVHEGELHYPPQTLGSYNRPCFAGPLDPALHEGKSYAAAPAQIKPGKVELRVHILEFLRYLEKSLVIEPIVRSTQQKWRDVSEEEVLAALEFLEQKGTVRKRVRSGTGVAKYAWVAPKPVAVPEDTLSYPALKEAAASFFKTAKRGSASNLLLHLQRAGVTTTRERVESVIRSFVKRGWLEPVKLRPNQKKQAFRWTNADNELAGTSRDQELLGWIVEKVKHQPGIRRSALRRQAQAFNVSTRTLTLALTNLLDRQSIFTTSTGLRRAPDPAFFSEPTEADEDTHLPRLGDVRLVLRQLAIDMGSVKNKRFTLDDFYEEIDNRQISASEETVDTVLRQLVNQRLLLRLKPTDSNSSPRYAGTAAQVDVREKADAAPERRGRHAQARAPRRTMDRQELQHLVATFFFQAQESASMDDLYRFLDEHPLDLLRHEVTGSLIALVRGRQIREDLDKSGRFGGPFYYWIGPAEGPPNP